ncbi:MAG: protein-L-isoaspartate(D-aspartate) O-methyltransferase [Polyangiaceae bacterium]|nr:protein-L-isoaspartate(D-aspartate) O-methyltransferase [Polyangiaceae bacterium]MCE7890133.1 protein-L-isoaspartate(D-aspartate) O-methyltransferase [Sorangiineae bacterium PRO1]MCL4748766.1 protein-L-isoaspartate(D-aspartate) O-methyltransferase [Myxococcales bacterium]
MKLAPVLVALVWACARREPTPSAAPTLAEAPATSVVPAPPPRPTHPAFSERVAEREALVRSIAGEGVTDERVLGAMRRVPRHAFVPAAVEGMAYADRPLPIGSGQTISQPFIVAFMTQAVAPKPTDNCLEIGTGSGYQAAVLAELCRRTWSIEYLPELADQAKKTLRALGYDDDRVRLRTGDGYVGWPEAEPFDVVVVTAAPEKVPQPLLDQLAVGGRLVIPVGPHAEAQALERWTRRAAGKGPNAFDRERLLDVRFVPFLGDGGR